MFFVNSYSIPVSSCGNINVSGSYELSNDVGGSSGVCFNIVPSNVYFNCQGNSIYGTGSIADYALMLFNASNTNQFFTNVTFDNCHFKNFTKTVNSLYSVTTFKNSILNESGEISFLAGTYIFENTSVIKKEIVVDSCGTYTGGDFTDLIMNSNIVNLSVSSSTACISLNNAKLDCQGNTIVSSQFGVGSASTNSGVINCVINSSTLRGVYLDHSYFSIENTVINARYGVVGAHSRFYLTVRNVSISGTPNLVEGFDFGTGANSIGHSTFDDILISGPGTEAFNCLNCENNTFKNVKIVNFDNSGFYTFNIRSNYNNHYFDNLTIYNNSGRGFNINTNNVTIINSNISNNGQGNIHYELYSGNTNLTMRNSYLGNFSKITVDSGNWSKNKINFYDNTFLDGSARGGGCFDIYNLTWNIPLPVIPVVSSGSVSVTGLPAFGFLSVLISFIFIYFFLI